MSWQAHEHNEQLKLQEDIEDALDRATKGKATDEDWRLISWACGVSRRQIIKGEEYALD